MGIFIDEIERNGDRSRFGSSNSFSFYQASFVVRISAKKCQMRKEKKDIISDVSDKKLDAIYLNLIL